jgi:thymidine kinase
MTYQGRRSGKTTEILRQARIRSKMGERVVVLCHHHNERKRLTEILRREAAGEKIEVMTASRATETRALRGRLDVSVLADEISAAEFDAIQEQLAEGQFKGGMATPNG